MATQTISAVPEAGHRGVDIQTTFVAKQEAFQDHLSGVLVPELNQYAVEINNIAENAINAISLETIEDFTTYAGSGLVIVKDIARGGNFISKTIIEINPHTGNLYEVDDGTVFAKLGGGFWARQYSQSAVNILWFGAKNSLITGNETFDSTLAIQKAINNHNFVNVPDGTFIVSSQAAYLNGSAYGVGGLILRSGVTLFGDGDKSIIKVKNNAYGSGALYGILRGDYVSDVAVFGLKFDGNKVNQVASTQCSNVYLHIRDNINVFNCFSINANGQSIQLVGKSTTPSNLVSVEKNIVDTATSIGIQLSHCNSPSILNNEVAGCVNNAIDIYNEDGDTTVSGKGGIVRGNNIKLCLTGVFIETSSLMVVSSNIITDCTSAGVHINRINGTPYNSNISNNIISGGAYSIRISGVGFNNFINGNTLSGFTTACFLLYGTSCSGLIATNNIIDFATNTTYFVELSNTTISNIQIVDNKANTLFGGDSYRLKITGSVGAADWFIQKPILINNTTQKDIISASGPITRGQTVSIPVAVNSSGILHLWGSSGGAWVSTATYTIISDTGTAKATKINDNFIAPGQLLGAISSSGLTLQLATTDTGSGGIIKYMIEYI